MSAHARKAVAAEDSESRLVAERQLAGDHIRLAYSALSRRRQRRRQRYGVLGFGGYGVASGARQRP